MPSRRPLASEPGLTWFLRVGTLDAVVTAMAWAAIAAQLCISLLGPRDPATIGALVVAAAGILIGRRRLEAGLALVVLAAAEAALLASDYVGPWTIAVLMLLSVTLRGIRSVPAGVLSSAVIYGALVLREDEGFAAGGALVAMSLCVAATAVGSAVRSQARYLDAMRERALEAVATRDLAVERGVSRERLRIAQDLHDAVGHEIAVVGMGLGVAEVQLERDPDAARTALHGAREGVQRVLRETQQILDILRHDGGGSLEAVADVRHLGALVETLRAADVPIDAHLAEAYPPLDPAVSAAAYRIAQEALTNAQRHGAGRIRLEVAVRGSALVVSVENPRGSGAPGTTAGSGYGLIGMRERAASAGGTLDVEDAPRRFRITAELPLAGGIGPQDRPERNDP